MTIRCARPLLVVLALPAALAACQSASPAVTAAAPAVVVEPPAPAARPVRTVRARRPELPCRHADLTAERKEALFRRFAALQKVSETAPPPEAADALPVPPVPPGPASDCRTATR